MRLLLLFVFVSATSGARILGVIPTPAYSHQVAFQSIWRELSLRGHQVTVLTTDPVNDPELTNLTEIDAHYSYKLMSDVYLEFAKQPSPIKLIPMLQNALHAVVEEQLEDPRVQELIRNETFFDVVMVESFFPEWLAFAELYKCPKILLTSMETQSSVHSFLGNPVHSAAYPEYVLPFEGKLKFAERLFSAFYAFGINIFRQHYAYPKKHEMIKKHFGESIPSIPQMMDTVDMLFLNVNPVLDVVRPYGPATVYFGGERKYNSNISLPKDLSDFLDDAKEGFIYLSFGSNVKSQFIGGDKMKAIMDALRGIPYKILWKFELDDLPNKPNNVKIIKWAPQQNILRHPNIKLFITQGGLQSIEESIFSHVPMVIVPFFADQTRNAKRMEAKGISKMVLPQPTLVKVQFKNAILEVIRNPKYRDNVKELARLARDQPMDRNEKVIWWTEYVIRNKGAQHFRNRIVDLPFYQYWHLDIAATIFTIYATVMFVFRLIKYAFKTFWGYLMYYLLFGTIHISEQKKVL